MTGVCSGTVTISNDGGTWQGRSPSTNLGDGHRRIQFERVGSTRCQPNGSSRPGATTNDLPGGFRRRRCSGRTMRPTFLGVAGGRMDRSCASGSCSRQEPGEGICSIHPDRKYPSYKLVVVPSYSAGCCIPHSRSTNPSYLPSPASSS